uniref:Uncharacterized protein n=1 Tax=Chromera velia CCMP2878 TaxID=1169474 RepID=A0A0G4FGG5_9ALVE|eukprot:Cvel_16861.t1-p1 / transcript=Cvel_16861.t1 / gene=Cvel_16861 / organism=Chromera_velia_CCMP2878 / gene_product=hypothetical protein / transcript_product=hypothetical protein / location=Cvel_scaffold1318:33243-34461(+) / protein_length=252 / sequence_SO=supercontig / SO=protein_coding / is_pseudo=false
MGSACARGAKGQQSMEVRHLVPLPPSRHGPLLASFVADKETAFDLSHQVVFNNQGKTALIFDSLYSRNGAFYSTRILDEFGRHLFSVQKDTLRPVWRILTSEQEKDVHSNDSTECEVTIVEYSRQALRGMSTFLIYRREELYLVCDAVSDGHVYSFFTPDRASLVAQSAEEWVRVKVDDNYLLRCAADVDQLLMVLCCQVINEHFHPVKGETAGNNPWRDAAEFSAAENTLVVASMVAAPALQALPFLVPTC